MKKFMLLLAIPAGLAAMSPTTSPTKKKIDGAVRVAREKVFRETDKQDIERKRARKVARSLVKQLNNERQQ